MPRHLHEQPQPARANHLALSLCPDCQEWMIIKCGAELPVIGIRKTESHKDSDNELSILLLRQFRAFRNEDPTEKQQKALPFSVIDELAKSQVTETDKSIVQLTIGAAIFACRSCEYSKVPRLEQKCTKLLCLQNIYFFRDGRLIMPAQSDHLESADSVVITFEMQKNDEKHDTVICRRTDESILCHVLQWAHLVSRIWTSRCIT